MSYSDFLTHARGVFTSGTGSILVPGEGSVGTGAIPDTEGNFDAAQVNGMAIGASSEPHGIVGLPQLTSVGDGVNDYASWTPPAGFGVAFPLGLTMLSRFKMADNSSGTYLIGGDATNTLQLRAQFNRDKDGGSSPGNMAFRLRIDNNERAFFDLGVSNLADGDFHTVAIVKPPAAGGLICVVDDQVVTPNVNYDEAWTTNTLEWDDHITLSALSGAANSVAEHALLLLWAGVSPTEAQAVRLGQLLTAASAARPPRHAARRPMPWLHGGVR